MICATCKQVIPEGHVFIDEGETYCAVHAPKGSHRWTPQDAVRPVAAAPPHERPRSAPDTTAAVTLAGLFMMTAAGFGVAGFMRLYSYDSDDRIVGGDAYNYIILTNRGVGLIGVGVGLAVLACAFLLLALLAHQGHGDR